MPEREQKTKGVALIALAGVNERLLPVELPAPEWTLIEGTFPEFAGLQSRLFGKRLLAKYAESIYSIFQFWTPLGYGRGLYQFTNTIDSGLWTTPTSNFIIPAIPPSLPFDGEGLTVDDFGGKGGSGGGGISEVVIIWTPVDVPNDTNGGPAGQGRRCRWEDLQSLETLEPFLVSALYGDTGDVDVTYSIPGPEVVPLGPVPAVTAYVAQPPGGLSAYLYSYKASGSYWVIDNGYVAHQGRRAKNGRVTISFASLQDDESVVAVSLDIRQRRLVPVPLLEVTKEFPLPFVRDINGVVPDYVIDMEDYLNFSFAPQVNSDGYAMIGDVYAVGLIVHRRTRICS